MHASVRLIEAGDRFLVELARQGDEGAVRVLVQRYNRRLYRVARAILRNDADAEEVVQEAHMSAFSALDRFRGESSFATWITRIALNAAFGRLRRRDVVGLEGIEPDATDTARVIVFPSSQLNPEQAMARSQVRELLEQVVEELPDSFRMVLVLRDIEDMSIEETGAASGAEIRHGEDAAAPRAQDDARRSGRAHGEHFARPVPIRRRALRAHG